MKNIDTLILSGGGIKGIGYIGIFKALEEIIDFNNIKKIYAISAGAIFASLFLLGYSYDELYQIIISYDFIKLIKYKHLNYIFNNLALSSDKNLKKLLQDLINFKISNNTTYSITHNITLKEFYDLTAVEFNIGVSNVTTKQFELWNYYNTPNIPLYIALLATSRIPFIYVPLKYNNCIYLDGGILDNFPFTNQDNNKNTLGIWITHSININDDISKLYKSNNDSIFNILHYLVFIIKLMIERFVSIKKNIINFHVIKIDFSNISSSINFKISNDLKKKLIISGYQQTINYNI